MEEIPAACGAFLFCRKRALEEASLGPGRIFDPDFFLYKEDIELCLRIRHAGRKIVYLPDVKVLHCRGWQQRKTIARSLRLTAAASELLLYRKHPSPYIIWALAKYLLVRFFRV
jgi:GT2 family glycosyltransferase